MFLKPMVEIRSSRWAGSGVFISVLLLSVLAALSFTQEPETSPQPGDEPRETQPDTIECPECHSMIPADSKFCAYCGALLPDSSISSSTASTISTISTASTVAAVLPRVLILIDPSIASPWGANYSVFKSVAFDLSSRGVPLVNPKFNQGIHWTAYQRAKTTTSRDAASRLALNYQAVLAVTYSCKTLKMGFGGDLDEPYTYRATVSGYVLQAASGRPVKTIMVIHRLGNGRDEESAEKNAVAQAAKAFGREVFRRINEWALQREQQGDPFLVRFFGAINYEQVTRLRGILHSIPRCQNAMQKRVSIGDPNIENFSEMSVRYRGAIEQLRRAVARAISSDPDLLVADVKAKGSHLVEVHLMKPTDADGLDGLAFQPESATTSLIQPASIATIGVKRSP